MRLEHPGHPGRAVRLAYCLNLHPGDDAAAIRGGIERITLPLAERLLPDRGPDRTFGVGMYAPAPAADELAEDPAARGELARFLGEHGLDPFTWNAFPFARFHEPGLKERVFEPTWADPERLEYTTRVAQLAVELARATAGPEPGARHLSISTHTGMHSSAGADPDLAAQALVTLAAGLAGLEAESGWRCVLALEPEPRANLNDTAELALWRAEVLGRNPAFAELLGAHLGTCLDACHAAVEFEDEARALANSVAHGAPLGKLQFTSALSLREPAAHPAARGRLLALDEPVFLHQVTGEGPAGELVRTGDLPELARTLARTGDSNEWLACREWRCHFHVPVDLDALAPGLGTTREHADRLLARLVADPARWGTRELHVELETYTWSLPSGPATDSPPPHSEALIDGLEAEYRHVLEHLAQHGWKLA